jgi:hypothetical protein
VQTKTTDLGKGQGGHLNLQEENTTNFNSISTDNKYCQSVNNENPDYSIILTLPLSA